MSVEKDNLRHLYYLICLIHHFFPSQWGWNCLFASRNWCYITVPLSWIGTLVIGHVYARNLGIIDQVNERRLKLSWEICSYYLDPTQDLSYYNAYSQKIARATLPYDNYVIAHAFCINSGVVGHSNSEENDNDQLVSRKAISGIIYIGRAMS